MSMKNFFVRVVKGECVLSIAAKYGVSVFDIISDNGLVKEVEEGEVLFIRSKEGCEKYTVRPEDSLSSIALKKGISEETLKSKNGNLPYVYYGMTLFV